MKNFHKESSGMFGARAIANCVTTGHCSESWACPWWDQALALTVRRHEAARTALNPSAKPVDRSPMYTEGSGAQDGVNSGPPFEVLPEGNVRATVSNLDTSLGRGSAEECACC